ncbi:hypothetical protein WOLCODRAFT_157965 [Wolfiporia cocos MD-104 SS10]|uniref:Uncharacterized protein n=1 Tax=Wolfiporia cocos (strain MD-104) TaxID=742152 RepID=A0A2H3JEV0_WOLCO|nr:hypothetical protein WOLCODRAFT_157965 [Wolfiporia cocos MD-104 SS10]
MLSRLLNLDASEHDNEDISMLPDELFIHAIEVPIIDRIKIAKPFDPIVEQALHALEQGEAAPSRTAIEDWQYSEGILLYKGRILRWVLGFPAGAVPQYAGQYCVTLQDLNLENQRTLLRIHKMMNDAQFERGQAMIGLPPCWPLHLLATDLVTDLHQLRSSARRSGSEVVMDGTSPSTNYPTGSENASGPITTDSSMNQESISTMSPQHDHHLDPPPKNPVIIAVAPGTGSSTAPIIDAPPAEYPSLDIKSANAPPIRYGSPL